VTRKRPALFRERHFEDVIILIGVRWYLQYSLSYRDLEEMMAERTLSVDHVTIWRSVQPYTSVLNQRIRREMLCPNRSWRVDSGDNIGCSAQFPAKLSVNQKCVPIRRT
jgi:transposase, IS6 family